jgi:hypothetical protein
MRISSLFLPSITVLIWYKHEALQCIIGYLLKRLIHTSAVLGQNDK